MVFAMTIKNRPENIAVFLCSILICFAGLTASGAEVPARADSLVVAGNKHYMDHEYVKAIDCYTRVTDMGYSASHLYFNLGNAWFKVNNFPKAILYYEKARLLDPFDEDIRQNLAIANSRIVDKIENIPEFFLYRWISALAVLLSPDKWALISVLLFALALTSFFLYLFTNGYRLKKLGFTTGVILVALSLSGILFMNKRKQLIRHSNGAIIMAPVVNVKSSPDEQGTSVFVLHEGTRVVLMDSVLQWKEVKIPDGNKGWIQDHDLAKI
jgi:tetratricopeptide (TPR) repeat protein